MLRVCGENPCLWQWDLNRRVVVDLDCQEVHFSNTVTEKALVTAVYEEAGQRYANIPNILLQEALPVSVYAYVEGESECFTQYASTIKVKARKQPEDYIYTETEILQYSALAARVEALEKNGGGSGGDAGADGITPHIGTNGNWFLGDTDTGVKAQGPKGDPGSDYILTEADKTEIAEEAADIVDDALSEAIGDPDGTVPAVPGYMALGMAGAAVGMVARIAAVDADGRPTEWEPVEMESGGGSGGESGGTWTILHEAELTEAAQIEISGFDTTLSEYLFTLIVPKVDATFNTGGNSHFLGARAFAYSVSFGNTGYASHYAYRGIMIAGGRMILQKYELNANGAGYDNEYRVNGKSVEGAVVACNVANGIKFYATFPVGTKFRLEGR